MARRTVQRLIAELIQQGHITAIGQARARRYKVASAAAATDDLNTTHRDVFPQFIPLAADSQDILAYIDLPLQARKPVGYQLEFLMQYQPNKTFYLAESLRRQLHKMGKTADMQQPAGTYSRAILGRLLIDLSWASSHQAVMVHVPEQMQASIQALIIEELRRLHEGVLARYGLRPSEYAKWKGAPNSR
ncbi:MAG: hypothetical protein PHF42_09605 [Pseudomonas sp.]|nr:hypothetical protein [Pseudomonas sp.]